MPANDTRSEKLLNSAMPGSPNPKGGRADQHVLRHPGTGETEVRILGGRPRPAALAAILCLVLYGCAEDSPRGSDGRGSELLEANGPLKELAWNGTSKTLYGIRGDEERMVELAPKALAGIEFDGTRRNRYGQHASSGEGSDLTRRTTRAVAGFPRAPVDARLGGR